jgi:hypothetical protein
MRNPAPVATTAQLGKSDGQGRTQKWIKLGGKVTGNQMTGWEQWIVENEQMAKRADACSELNFYSPNSANWKRVEVGCEGQG